MENDDSINEWNIKTNIGPISFNILLDSAFFNYSSIQHSERHNHATYEFHFITKGTGIICADNAQCEVIPDSFYLVKDGVHHMQKGCISNPIERYSFKFEFDICDSKEYNYPQEEIKSFIYLLSNIRFFYSKNFNHIKYLVYEIQSELQHKSIGYYIRTQHLFSLLFIGIIREIAIESKQQFEVSPIKINKENRMGVIEDFFELNYNYKATSQELCQLIHISKSQLNRILKEKYHMSFKQKHMEIQTEHIKYLLLNTDLSIKTITEKFAYSSESNFSAFFKRYVGISPKYFREQGKLL